MAGLTTVRAAAGSGGAAWSPDLTGDVLAVAPRLLGCTLTVTGGAGTVAVRLTEVEAYAGADDPASHAFRGPTARTEVMFGPAGRLYVYRSMGLHWCANVVTGEEGTASAVLLRAGEVVEGLDLARERRGPRASDRDLARGPGRLCQALGIGSADDGAELVAPRFAWAPGPEGASIVTGPRVGVSRAADRPWRFWLEGDGLVSAYRRSPRAPARQPGSSRE